MILNDALGCIKPTIGIIIKDKIHGDLTRRVTVGELYHCPWLSKSVLEIKPLNESTMSILIDLENLDMDDELSERDYNDIQDLLATTIENYSEIADDPDVGKFYKRKMKRYSKIADKIDTILDVYD